MIFLYMGLAAQCVIIPALHIFLNHVVSFNQEQIPNLRAIVEWVNPRGGTHIFGRTGMCRPNGSLFYKKSLNMGPVFYQKKSLNMGQFFWLSPKLRDFWGFHHAKTPKITEFLKNRPIFEGKSLKMGTLFGQNHPLRWVWVLRLERHTPVQLKSEYPQGVNLLFCIAD